MHQNTAATQPRSKPDQRPLWLRLLIWTAMVAIAVNVLAIGGVKIGLIGHLAIALGLGAAISQPYGSLNLLRTWSNAPTADFTRRDDPARGGYVNDVRPARASRTAILLPLPLAAFLAMWGVVAVWIFYAAMALYFIVIGIIVLPGARDRKPTMITVSPQGIESGELRLPLHRIVDLAVTNNGVKVSREPLMPRLGGVPTSSMVGRGRGLGNRQAARSFALTLRGDGESHGVVIAGGLTQDCAENLHRDVRNALETFRATDRG